MTQRIALAIALVFSMLAASLHAQQIFVQQTAGGVAQIANLNGGFYGSGGTYKYNVPQDPFMMLRLPQFAKEIELVDEQKKKIEELQKDANELRQAAWGEYSKVAHQRNGNGNVTDFQKLQAEFQKSRQETAKRLQERLDEILLPHQVARLRELLIQIKIATRGVYAMSDTDIAEALDVSEEQKKELKQKQAEAQRKLQEEISKLRATYQEEVLKDVLSREQLLKLEKIQGKKYEVKRPDYSKIYSQYRRAEKKPGEETNSAEKK
ncbi:MAG: hypothetical protein ACI9HK_000946 [Pirellulaceae bacterium]|jgi:hypothetical protein